MAYDYKGYYAELIKPFFAPPSWVFGVAWGIIYPLIAIAFFLTLYFVFKKKLPNNLLYLFIINMAGNFVFTPIQFVLKNNALAALDILLVLVTLALFEYRVFNRSKIIFFLMLPYLLWGSFATVLQLSITYLNFFV